MVILDYCLDTNGNQITNLSQWDMGQKVVIPRLGLTKAPLAYFYNKMFKNGEAISALTEIVDDYVYIEIPNIMLQKAYTLEILVCEVTENDTTTLCKINLPVRERAKPDDYAYVENIKTVSLAVFYEDVVTAVDNAKNELQNETKEIVSGIKDGSPKGVYIDVSELTAKPSGIYLNGETGYIHYWDGEILSDPICLYQSMGIGEGTIDQTMLNEELSNKINAIGNKADKSTTLNGYGITDAYTKQEVDNKISTTNSNIETINSQLKTNYGCKLYFDETTNTLSLKNTNDEKLGDSVSVKAGIDGIAMHTESNEEGVYYLVLSDENGEELTRTLLPATGGGSSITSNIKLEKITSSPIVATPNDKVVISVNFTDTDSDGDSVDATYILKNGNTTIQTGQMKQGINTFEITNNLAIGSQNIKLKVTDDLGNTAIKSWTVQLVSIGISSTFNDQIRYDVNSPVNFTYTPTGTILKTIHFKLDGEELPTVDIDTAGSLQTYTIPPQSHGSHLLECWVTANINNLEVESSHIYKDIVWFDSESDVPVISCIYRSDYYGTLNAKQYNPNNITYCVFDPNTSTPTVTLSIDGDIVLTQTLDNSVDTWIYKSMDSGVHTLEIACGETKITINVDVEELNVNIEPITDNLAFDFNPIGYSNNSENRLWQDTNNSEIVMTVSDGFDWINGGYQIDDEGNQYFCIKAGDKIQISHNLFERNSAIYGSEFKMVYKTTNVKKADAEFLNCLPSTDEIPVGLKMNVHNATLMTSAGELFIPYSEDDIIEFEYNINTLDTSNSNSTSYILTYEDGTPLRPMVYDSTHRLYQFTPAPITIGSPHCDVHIYRMKAYNTFLTNEQIEKNFIADARDSDTMIDRFNRNQIYNEENLLTPESVAKARPDLKIIKISCPHFTNDKKDFVKNTTIECIHKNGRPIEDNWLFENCYHAGQGTTSNEYGAAGRNLDLLCCFDGVHQVNDKIPLDTSYKTKLTLGYGTNEETVITDGTGKISLSDTSIPNNWFNIKVNIASSENSNNALLQKRFDRYLPYSTPAKRRDSRCKNSMEFYNCVVFVRETDVDLNSHREFDDTDFHFYGIGNIGDSKKTDITRVNDPTDMNEFVVEISDNTFPNSIFPTGITDVNGKNLYPIDKSQWKSGNTAYDNLYNNWEGSFEFRYDCCGDSKDGSAMTTDEEKKAQRAKNKQIWRDFYTWVVTSTDEEFVNELSNWFIKESALYWYLFTERYIMIDNRAKNTFWHWGKIYITQAEAESMGDEADNYIIDDNAANINNGYRFEMWDYDNDTALGINNSGELSIDYGKEDIDYRVDGVSSSGYVFNAAEHTFWGRIRKLMGNDLAKLYQNVDKRCWSADNFIREKDKWQSQFGEELWRLDFERKYLRTYLEGTPRYFKEMAFGQKKYQCHQFERDQEKYVGTKYLHSDICADQIMFRCNTPLGDDIVVTPDYTIRIVPYSDMYLSVKLGNSQNTKQIRAKAGVEYEIDCSFDKMDDTTVLIYCASRIQSLNDLSACYIDDNEFKYASRIQQLIIGSDIEGYSNPFLTTLSVGNNTLLEKLDIRNCPNLSNSINLSQCGNLAELYAEGTALTGVTFAVNGKLTIAHLPDTINNLTLKSMNYLKELLLNYANIETLVIENCKIDTLNIVRSAIDTLQNLILTNVDWDLDDTTLLDKIAKIRSANISGTIHLPSINTEKYNKYTSLWKNLTITYDKFIKQYPVSFQDWDGTVLFTEYVDDGNYAYDPIVRGDIETPTRESDVTTVYTYNGWNMDLETISIRTATTVIAIYSTSTRQYTVTFMNGLDVLQQTTVGALGSVHYVGNTPTKDNTSDTYYLFKQWLSSDWDKTYNEESANVWNDDKYTVSYIVSDITITTEFTKCQVPDFPRMYLDKDKLAQGIREGVYEEVDGVKVGVPQYDYLYTNDPKYTSCYTLEEFYAICKSDIFNTPYKLDSTGVEHCYTEIGDKIRIKLDSTQVIGGDPYGLGYGTIICEIYGYNAYELEDSNDLGEYTGQEILAKFESETELLGKDNGLYLNSNNGYVYHWNGETTEKIKQVMSHIVFGLQMGDSLATNNPDKVYGHLIDTTYQMNTSNTNAYGWGDDSTNYKCKMNRWLNDGYAGSNNGNSVLSYLPRSIQQIISPVKVKSSKGNVTEDGTTTFYVTPVTSVCNLFLFAYGELWGTSATPYLNEMSKWSSLVTLDDAGNPKNISQYKGIVNNNCNIRKPYLGTGSASWWWTRSPWSGSSHFAYVYSSYGYGSHYDSSGAVGVAFGFNIG